MKCCLCTNDLIKKDDRLTSGYGTIVQSDPKGNVLNVCYPCCAIMDRNYMIKEGRITLYLYHASKESRDSGPLWYKDRPLDPRLYDVINWPSSLKIPVLSISKGNHNITGRRIDVWFRGPDGYIWHGVQYGYNTDILHCRRTKRNTVV